MLIAAMVNTLPRMVESVDTFFRTGNNSNVPIDEQLVSDLFDIHQGRYVILAMDALNIGISRT